MTEQQTQKVPEPKAGTEKNAVAEGKESQADGKEEIGKNLSKDILITSAPAEVIWGVKNKKIFRDRREGNSSKGLIYGRN